MNRRTIIIIFSIALLVGIGIVAQSRVTNGLMLYVAPSTVQDYRAMAEGEKQNLENVQNRINDAKEKLQDYEENLYNQESKDILENISDEYIKYGIYSGRLSVHGPGVIITVDDGNRELFDGEDINNLLVHDEDVFMIINELKRAGAEAISVNGQRILSDTSISCSGYTVRINGVTYARPFKIQAIGNARKMSSILLGPEGYATNLKEWGVIFKIKTSDEIIIEGNSDVDNYVYKYSKTI
ncbi:MAG: DUF881 domain-containing protein [Eubacteriales bacterium]|nr:DUF881 domain-containing protein [Eubacteriales bacterium]MDD4389886.1 DUF881 domain-containing protein [Eubacteriales bacterium]